MKRFILSLGLITLLGTSLTACAGESARAKDQKGKETATTKAASPIQTINAKYMREHIFDYNANPTKFVFKGNRPAVLDFYADWCGPCRQLSPRLEQIAKKYEGQIDVYKINVDNEEELARVFGVRSIPMLLFIPMEGTPIQSMGALSLADLEKAVGQILP